MPAPAHTPAHLPARLNHPRLWVVSVASSSPFPSRQRSAPGAHGDGRCTRAGAAVSGGRGHDDRTLKCRMHAPSGSVALACSGASAHVADQSRRRGRPRRAPQTQQGPPGDETNVHVPEEPAVRRRGRPSKQQGAAAAAKRCVLRQGWSPAEDAARAWCWSGVDVEHSAAAACCRDAVLRASAPVPLPPAGAARQCAACSRVRSAGRSAGRSCWLPDSRRAAAIALVGSMMGQQGRQLGGSKRVRDRLQGVG